MTWQSQPYERKGGSLTVLIKGTGEEDEVAGRQADTHISLQNSVRLTQVDLSTWHSCSGQTVTSAPDLALYMSFKCLLLADNITGLL